MVHFEWSRGNWKYGDASQSKLYSYDANNKIMPINVLPSSVAEKMLGVFVSPDGKETAQIDFMKDKAIKLGEYIQTGHVQKHEAWIAMSTMVMKALEYLLPALNISENDMTSIMWPILKHFLPKSGLNRYIARKVLYGSFNRQGLCIKNPFLQQGINHVVDIVENLWKGTITGHHIQATLEQLWIELGCNQQLLESDYSKYQNILLTESWIRSTWEFCSSQNITIKDNTPYIPLLRENNVCIMEEFLKHPLISESELHSLNKCRIFLQSFSLADITTGDGKEISKAAWDGKAVSPYRKNIHWPRWGKPTPSEWSQWKRAIRLTFTNQSD